MVVVVHQGVGRLLSGQQQTFQAIILQIAFLIDNHRVIYRHYRQPVIINCHMCHIVMNECSGICKQVKSNALANWIGSPPASLDGLLHECYDIYLLNYLLSPPPFFSPRSTTHTRNYPHGLPPHHFTIQ